ncbi:MAG: hypothetical protein ACI9XK_004343 [Granulosicoccus sp.]
MKNLKKNYSLAKLSITGADAIWLISANDLLTGGVVYMTPTSGWSRVLSDAFTISEKSVALSHLANLVSDQSIVLGHTLVEANLHTDGALTLSHYRDRIREDGPTLTGPTHQCQMARHPSFKAHELNTGKP